MPYFSSTVPSTAVSHQSRKLFVVSVIVDDCIWHERDLQDELCIPQACLDTCSIEELLIQYPQCVFHGGLEQIQREQVKPAVFLHHQTDLHKLIGYKPQWVSYSSQRLKRYVSRRMPNTICHAGMSSTTSIQSWQTLAGGMQSLLGLFGFL